MQRWPAALVLFCACPVGAAETRATIPEQFRGTWASSSTRCIFGGESMLSIDATAVDFYESRGRVLAVAVDGDSNLAVLLESAGEGQTWLATRQFKLSEDHNTLTDVTGGPHFDRVRCPDKSK